MTTSPLRVGPSRARLGLDAVLRGLGRFVLRVFFRDIDVQGATNFPTKGPVIVVANHANSLIDGVLIASFLPRFPRMLTASTVWHNTAVIPFLTAAGAIPVYRQAEVGRATARAKNRFSVVWDELARHHVIAIFPEGISHDHPYLLPVKSGTARIALEAELQRGPLGVQILPIGLEFENKTRFRSRAVMRIGAALSITEEAERYATAEAAQRQTAVRDVTARIGAALQTVTSSFASWDEARLLGRAAEIWARPQSALPTDPPLPDKLARRRAFADGYAWLQNAFPDRAQGLRQRLQDYDREMRRAGLRDAQIGATYPLSRVAGYVMMSLMMMAVWLPISIIGTLLNVVPYLVARAIAWGKDRDKIATWAVFSSVFVFPLFWGVQALAARQCVTWSGTFIDGQTVGWLTLLAAPLAGAASLPFHDIRSRFWREVRGWTILRLRPDLSRRLSAERRGIHTELSDIVALYRAETETT